MKYTITDLRQTMIGAFISSLVFMALKSGVDFSFNAKAGIIITMIVIWLSKPKSLYKTFMIDILVTYFVVSLLGMIFKLTTIDLITFGLSNGSFPSNAIFGSAIAVSFWISLPVAVLYNKHNLDNFLSRIFIKKR